MGKFKNILFREHINLLIRILQFKSIIGITQSFKMDLTFQLYNHLKIIKIN